MTIRINYIWLLSVLFCIFMLACDEVIEDYNFPATDKKLVVNSLFNQDSVFSVKVSQTYPYYDKDPLRYIYIEDATVDLYINDTYYETLARMYEGKYRSENYFPETGNVYKIVVNAGGFDTVQAQSYIPETVDITIDSLYPATIDNKEYIACELMIDDPAENNYYYLTSNIDPDYFRSKIKPYDKYNYWVDDEKIGKWSSEEEEIPEIFVFSDEYFNNSEFKFILYGSPLYTSENALKVFFSLYSITEDLYNYIKTMNNQNHTAKSNLVDITPVFNNIENGLGIFSGYNVKQDSFFFEGTETEILYYGEASYNNKNYGINEVKYLPNEDNDNFELSIGNIIIYIDSKTSTLKSNGLMLSLIMASGSGDIIENGVYELNSSAANSVISGESRISEQTEEIFPDPITILSGRIEIINFYHDDYNNEDIIELDFNFTLTNNISITGNYEGPLTIVD